MLLLVAVPADGVIVEAGIFDQSDPLAPPRRNVAAVVLVEVLAEEGCKVETGREGGVGLVHDDNLVTDASLIFALSRISQKQQTKKKIPLCSCYLCLWRSARTAASRMPGTVPAYPRNGIIADRRVSVIGKQK